VRRRLPPRRTRLALAAAASTSAAAVTAWAYHHLVPSPKCTARRRRATGGRAQLRGTARGALGATWCCCIISIAAAGAADRGSVRPSAGSVRRTCLACPSNCERSTARCRPVAYVVRVLRARRTAKYYRTTELWTRSTTFCAAGGLNFRARPPPHTNTHTNLTNSVAQGGLDTPADPNIHLALEVLEDPERHGRITRRLGRPRTRRPGEHCLNRVCTVGRRARWRAPEGPAIEVARRRPRVTTTVSSNDGILTTGSLPAALLLPAAISSSCAHLMPPCALRSLTFAAHLARSLRVPPQRSSDAVERAAEKRTAVEGTAIAHASCYKPSQLRC
jgi:hypothetical protein